MTGVSLLQNIPGWVSAHPNAILVAEVGWGYEHSGGAITWTDITTDILFSGPINITPMGRSDSTSKTQPAACTFTVGANNSAIKYMLGPQSPNYPDVRKNVPVRVWVSLTGDPINRVVQFQGEIWSFKPASNKRGNVTSVTIRAGGKMRQLTQGTQPARSALRLAYTNSTVQPLAYWSMEDGRNATQFASGLIGGQPAVVTDGQILWENQITTCPGSDGLPNMAQPIGAGFSAATGPIPAGSDTFWSVDFTAFVEGANLPAEAQCAVLSLAMSSGTWDLFGVTFNNNFGSLQFFAQERGTITEDLLCEYDPGNIFDGLWHHYRLTATQSGGNVVFTIEADGATAVTNTVAGTIAHLDDVILTGGNPVKYAYGHVAVFDQVVASFYDASIGYAGETATTRLTRLFAQQGVQLDIDGTSDALMGPQGVGTFMDLARECEAADLGVLGDGRGPGCFYVTRSARYNQPVALALDATNLGEAPSPEDDDQKTRNRYTVKRKNGSEASFEDTDGPLGTVAIGTYDAKPDSDLNLSSDDVLESYAQSLVALGTVGGYRYPSLTLNLAKLPTFVNDWIDHLPGKCRVTVDNVRDVNDTMPAGLIDVLAEGWSQQISPKRWTATLNCSSALPWNVYALDTNFPLGADGQTLNSSLAPGATTMSVATAAGKPLLSTVAGDYPVDMDVGGWPIHITAVSGSGSPQTATITAAPNTSILPAGTVVTDWRPPGLGL